VPEVDPHFSRDWVEFTDPSNSDEIFKCDLTWLTSYWSCIFGAGCCGIDDDRPNDGCCSDGAYYSDESDEARTLKVAERLTPQTWQFFDEAQPTKSKSGKSASSDLNISEIGVDGDRKTRMVEGSCIFLNRKGYEGEGFTGSFGCVLHHLALAENIHFVETKPDVCWQLPIRRSFEKREVGEREYTVTVIGEYERLAWGDGGADFDWYCTSNTEAHFGRQPVYISNEIELRKLMGDEGYGILKEHCDNRMEAIATLAKARKRRQLPLIALHPASVGARSAK
jgi:hypothetical protein